MVQTFLRSVGGPCSTTEMAEDLATHDSFLRADGWMSDGPTRAYDHYNGWALHLYPILWARMAGAGDLAAERRGRDLAALDRFLQDAVTLVGADGSPLIQGRSLIYRFAAAAPFWVGALAQVPSLAPGMLREAATRTVWHFVDRGVPDEHGLLPLGWYGPWPRLAQDYSGPSSPYWASKGLLGIALPADHPVWTSPAQPLPVDSGETLRAAPAPGWLIASTRADGIVRVINHGTDHADEGADVADSPLYARIGYSTATAPVLDESGWTAPVDQSVVLIDEAGRCTHRSGMRTLTVRVDGDGPTRVGVAGSVASAHWVDADLGKPDHGTGRAGRSRPAAHITVFSLVRGMWELRLVRIDDIIDTVDPAMVRLRIGGWAVAGDGGATQFRDSAIVTGSRLASRLTAVRGTAIAGATRHVDGGPLGAPVRVPWLDYAAQAGVWVAVLVELSADATLSAQPRCRTTVVAGDHELSVRIDWPDGLRTHTRLPDPRSGPISKENG